MKYSFVLFTVAVVLAAFFHGSQSAIIGVDLGSKYFKVALVKPGTPFEIVTNVHTKRKAVLKHAFDLASLIGLQVCFLGGE